MSLKQWAENGWLRPHKTSAQEIGNLLAIVERDLKDASIRDLSPDARFTTAYNAALKLCTICLYAEGYRAERNMAHYRTIEALPLILGADRSGDVDYLNTCRSKRNTSEYDYIDVVSDDDADELIGFVGELKDKVMTWLKSRHGKLVPS